MFVPIDANKKIKIGMDYNTVCEMVGESHIISTQDMGNGYKWIKAWIYPFQERILANLCFDTEILAIIELYPYINSLETVSSWDNTSEKQLNDEKKMCDKWINKNKKQLPDEISTFKDLRSWSAGVVIKKNENSNYPK